MNQADTLREEIACFDRLIAQVESLLLVAPPSQYVELARFELELRGYRSVTRSMLAKVEAGSNLTSKMEGDVESFDRLANSLAARSSAGSSDRETPTS